MRLAEQHDQNCAGCGYRVLSVAMVCAAPDGLPFLEMNVTVTGHIICPQCKSELLVGPQAAHPAAGLIERENWKES